MTWTKLSDDFGDQCARAALSDAAFRTHVEGLCWAMRRETGGLLDALDIRRMAETLDPASAVAELLAAGFWETLPDGRLLIVANMVDQPEPELIAKRRELTADRVRKHRLKKAGLESGNAVTERVTRDGAGRDGSGRETHYEHLNDEEGFDSCSDPDSWPPTAPLGQADRVGAES